VKFSVLLASRNRPGWVGSAIASVLAQAHTDWQLVLLDNSDESYEGIPTDPRIEHHFCEARDVAHAYALAVERASGDILVPLGDDDTLPSDCLAISDERFGESLWLNGVTVLYNEAGGEIARRGGDKDSLERTLKGTYWLGGAVHWRRELTEDGSYLSEYEGAADYALYLRFIHTAPPVLVGDVMYRYTDWPGTDSNVRALNQQNASRRIAEGTR
jgi:glycosyltransferase involved in cell wall biosynthesis